MNKQERLAKFLRKVDENVENLSMGAGLGLTNQLEATAQMLRHPINSVKDIGTAMKAVAQDPSLIAAALRADYDKATSGPLGLGEVAATYVNPKSFYKKIPHRRDIIVPENMALPHENRLLFEAKKEYLNQTGNRSKILPWETMPEEFDRITDLAKWQDEFANAFGGWYPLNEHGRTFMKEIGPLAQATPEYYDLRVGQKVPLSSLVEPELIERFKVAKAKPPKVVRADSSFGLGAHYDPSTNEIVSHDLVSSFLPHEVQHAVQEAGKLPKKYLGSNMAASPNKFDYYLNPGEIQARISALRAYMGADDRTAFSQPMMEALAERRGKRIRKTGQPFTYENDLDLYTENTQW